MLERRRRGQRISQGERRLDPDTSKCAMSIQCSSCQGALAPGSRFCVACGAPAASAQHAVNSPDRTPDVPGTSSASGAASTQPTGRPPNPAEGWATATHPPHPAGHGPRNRRPALVILLVLLIALGGLSWVLLVYRSADPARSSPGFGGGPSSSADGPTAAEPAASPSVVEARTSCESAPSQDSSGQPVSYGVANLSDGDPRTAWRCDGTGVGQYIEFRFAGPSRLHRIGIIPGYAKIDPADGTDRYVQNRRVSSVRYEFDGGSVAANLSTDVAKREPQVTDVDAISDYVRVVIESSVPGSQSGTQLPTEKVAISELAVS